MSAVDPDAGDTRSFALLDDAGGRFALVNGNLVVANGSLLDFEQAASHQVTVRATDGHGLSFDTVLAVSLSDVLNENITGTPGADKFVGGASNDQIYGAAGNDALFGGGGADRLVGGSGNDKLYGGMGNDVLTGASGRDVFVFDTKLNKKGNVDKITDFNVKYDSIYLDNAIFKMIGKGTESKPGKLNKNYFTIGDKAQDKNDFVIYDNKKGILYYDADGSGKGAAIQFATLTKNLKMTASDFFVI